MFLIIKATFRCCQGTRETVADTEEPPPPYKQWKMLSYLFIPLGLQAAK